MAATRPASDVLRHPSPADAEQVLALLRARERADLGTGESTLEEVEATWAAPGFALDADAWTVQEDGALRGYASLLGDDLLVAVHPDATGRGVGTRLREAGECRAVERGTRVLRQFLPVADAGARAGLLAAGWWPVHHYVALRLVLSRAPAPPRVPVRAVDPDRDLEAVWHLVQGAYAGAEGFLGQTLEAWRATTVDAPGWDPSLWLLRHDSEGLAGVALGERGPGATGIVRTLAVVDRARGRGHGRALLLLLLEAFRRAGHEVAEAAVHGPTARAAALFESAGMTVVRHVERWEKTLGR